jgi:hypothetical protein
LYPWKPRPNHYPIQYSQYSCCQIFPDSATSDRDAPDRSVRGS